MGLTSNGLNIGGNLVDFFGLGGNHGFARICTDSVGLVFLADSIIKASFIIEI